MEKGCGIVMVMIVEPQYIEAVWPKIWPLIESAVLFDSEESLKGELKVGEQVLFICGDCAVIVRPSSDVFWINYVGGENLRKYWPEISSAIDRMAGESKMIAAVARTAWKKFAPDYEATEQRVYVKRK